MDMKTTCSFEEELIKMGDPDYSLILVGEERYNNMVNLLSNKNEKEEELQDEINNLKRINQNLKEKLQKIKNLTSVLCTPPIVVIQKARALGVTLGEARDIIQKEINDTYSIIEE